MSTLGLPRIHQGAGLFPTMGRLARPMGAM